jgi:Secretion system C-terminal sorting domain
LDHFGIITKISKEGDSLWTRYYQHVESVADDHIFYDVEESPDGGFVMVGQATDFYTLAESPLQRAWIVKTDEHGCVVPGCHLVSSIIDLQKAPFEIKLFPNPVSATHGDYLNVYFYHPGLKGEAVFQMVDVSGKVLLEFSSSLGDVTHMVPLSNLSNGMYWLTCRVGDAVLTEAVVVE